jgi:hypothetical protein
MSQVSRTASAFFGGANFNSGPILCRLQHDGRSPKGFTFTTVERDPTSNRIVTGEPKAVPFGTQVIADLGGFKWGPGCYRPFDMSHLVPYGQPIPVVGDTTQGEYVDLIEVICFVKGFGLCEYKLGGVLAQNAFHTVWAQFGRSPEAAEGKLPIITLNKSEPIPVASRLGEIFYKPSFALTGWVERDAAMFGARTVPAPQVRLGGGATPAGALPNPVPVSLPVEISDPFQQAETASKAAVSVQDDRPMTVTSGAAKPQF